MQRRALPDENFKHVAQAVEIQGPVGDLVALVGRGCEDEHLDIAGKRCELPGISQVEAKTRHPGGQLFLLAAYGSNRGAIGEQEFGQGKTDVATARDQD
ncbi:MAG: hypothetical protein WCH13_11430, partial [Deltaproteobacteria bacterium]